MRASTARGSLRFSRREVQKKMVNQDQIQAALGAGEGSRADQAPVAVVGFGTAGFNAVVALRTAGYRGDVLVFSDAGARPYSPILTSYYAAGAKTREECYPWSDEEIAELGIELVREPVVALDVAAHVVRTRAGEHSYAKCVVASGSRPMSYGFPEDCGYAPLMLHSMDDAERLREALTRPGCERVLVSGASMVALKMLEAALMRGVKAVLVGMNAHVLDMSALPASAERFERGLAARGVELRMGQVIKAVSVVADESRPLGRRLEVTFSTGEVDTFDEICVAHGMKANLDFVAEGSLAADRALIVDDFMRTSDADVFAAGDVAQATELISGEKRVVGIWKNAAAGGVRWARHCGRACGRAG